MFRTLSDEKQVNYSKINSPCFNQRGNHQDNALTLRRDIWGQSKTEKDFQKGLQNIPKKFQTKLRLA